MELFGFKDEKGNDYKLIIDKCSDAHWERIKKATPEPEFKVGDWVIKNTDNEIERIKEIYGVNILYDNGCYHYQFLGHIRHATPQEIESHLRKICDEKYHYKRVKCLHCGDWCNLNSWDIKGWYQAKDDVFRYGDIVVYMDGKFAEVETKNKPLPKNLEELVKLLYDFRTFDKKGEHTET